MLQGQYNIVVLQERATFQNLITTAHPAGTLSVRSDGVSNMISCWVNVEEMRVPAGELVPEQKVRPQMYFIFCTLSFESNEEISMRLPFILHSPQAKVCHCCCRFP